jgi:hypothetical protein
MGGEKRCNFWLNNFQRRRLLFWNTAPEQEGNFKPRSLFTYSIHGALGDG